ncbi:uncharacterized protein LOC106874069 isoform X5 [Octopus bimaculoides]|nr:uncharacterized protein LOC106874069 isoform X5 [Octopus bimaculoides]
MSLLSNVILENERGEFTFSLGLLILPQIMEFNLLYLKYLFIIQFFCVSLEEIDIVKFVRKKQPTALECLELKNIEYWQIRSLKMSSPGWSPLKTNEFEANVLSGEANILSVTLLSNSDLTLICQGTDKGIKFQAIPLYNDIGNLYPSSETPNAIKDKKFTLKCKTMGTGTTVIWYTGNGTVIAKYIGILNQNIVKYFGSRQETSCQSNSCTLSITNVSLDEDNMDIICKSGLHTSMYSITVFVLPKSVTIKAISDTVPVENQIKSYECLIKDAKPEFSVFWLITRKNGTQENATKNISNNSSKSGDLITLSSKLTLTLHKRFKELQCVAYFLDKTGIVTYSKKLDMLIEYSPEKDTMTLNVFGGKVCADTPTKFQCSWKGGHPPANVTLMYKNVSNTSKEEVELNVIPSKFHQTVKCLGIHIAANVSREKNFTIYYPPQVNIHISNETNNTLQINCTAFGGNPEIYEYKLEQKWGNATKNTYNMNVLSINNPSFSNTGTWECHVSNEDFHVNKSSNYKFPMKPIFSSISNNPKKRNVAIGESVIFKQCFYSHPKSDVKWQKNENLIDSNKYLTTDYLSSEFPFKGSCTSVKIEDIKDNDFGTYTLTVENTIGKKVIIFAMRLKEIVEVPLRIIIGCTVGIVLLIILGLLAYKCHKKRGVKHNKKDTVGTNPLEDAHMVSIYGINASLTGDVEDVYATISSEPSTVEDQDAEISDPRYLCMRHLNMDGAYVNISKKPGDVEGTYINVSKKPGGKISQNFWDDLIYV